MDKLGFRTQIFRISKSHVKTRQFEEETFKKVDLTFLLPLKNDFFGGRPGFLSGDFGFLGRGAGISSFFAISQLIESKCACRVKIGILYRSDASFKLKNISYSETSL